MKRDQDERYFDAPLPTTSKRNAVQFSKTASEVQNKMIIMGHQISSCHVSVVRSFFILKRCCYHLVIFHMITFLSIIISSSIIPISDLVLSHNSSRDVPISTSPVPKSHIIMSHISSCYDPNINFSCPQKTLYCVP